MNPMRVAFRILRVSLAFPFQPLSSIRIRVAVLAILVFFSSSPAYSWGPFGHSILDHTAIDALPDDGPVFLKKYVDYIADQAAAPDTWRGDEPFARIAEDPNHTWFRERLTYLNPVPRSRYEYVLAIYKHYEQIKATDPLTAERTNVRWSGTLPYAAAEAYGDLVEDFRIYRDLKAANKDTRYIEQTCAFLITLLGHYIGDGSQPLHVSIQVNGWVGLNPNGYTTEREIHSRFEGLSVRGMKVSESDILPLLGPPGHLTGDTFDSILAFLDQSGSHVEEVYKLDQHGAFAAPYKNADGRRLIVQCISDGARMLRDLTYKAWLESGQNPAIERPAPYEPKNPRYNPETGSAPARKMDLKPNAAPRIPGSTQDSSN